MEPSKSQLEYKTLNAADKAKMDAANMHFRAKEQSGYGYAFKQLLVGAALGASVSAAYGLVSKMVTKKRFFEAISPDMFGAITSAIAVLEFGAARAQSRTHEEYADLRKNALEAKEAPTIASVEGRYWVPDNQVKETVSQDKLTAAPNTEKTL